MMKVTIALGGELKRAYMTHLCSLLSQSSLCNLDGRLRYQTKHSGSEYTMTTSRLASRPHSSKDAQSFNNV